MVINVSGYALRILDDFVYYASTYPGRLAEAMWWCEDGFVYGVGLLKEAFDEAVAADDLRNY